MKNDETSVPRSLTHPANLQIPSRAKMLRMLSIIEIKNRLQQSKSKKCQVASPMTLKWTLSVHLAAATGLLHWISKFGHQYSHTKASSMCSIHTSHLE